MGALDMGGASTQISFLPRGPILDESTQATFRLYGTDYSIYTHSYLCFGRDQMLNRLLAALVQVRLAQGGREARQAAAQAPCDPAEQPWGPPPSPMLPQRFPDHAALGLPL